MDRRTVLLGGGAAFLSGCSTRWAVDYGPSISPAVSRNWTVRDVQIDVPTTLTVSEANSLAPNADIVWHGDPLGDRRKQVGDILKEGIERGVTRLNGPRPVIILASLREFHAVTPKAIVLAFGAVHNIQYVIQVVDARTSGKLTEPTAVTADLEALVKDEAVSATFEGNTQKVRIVNHLARVTEAWLGVGPDASRRFTSFGR